MADGNVAADQLRLFGERWRTIPGAGLYEVSDLGRIISHRRGTANLMKPGPGTSKMRYLRVTLTCDDGSKRCLNVHHLVLSAFRPKRAIGALALHGDGCVANCRLSNLYWGTAQSNALDRIHHGRSGKGESNPNARLSAAAVSDIRTLSSERGISQVQLGRMFGISQVHVGRIVNAQSWQQR